MCGSWQGPRMNLRICELEYPSQFMCPAFFIFFVPTILCFNEDVHQAIGMASMSGIHSGALQRLSKLFNSKDVSDIGYWAHQVNKVYALSKEFHFQHQESTTPDKINLQDCGGNMCLHRSTLTFFELLANGKARPTTYPLDFTEIDPKFTPNGKDQYRFLITLIGDLHSYARYLPRDFSRSLSFDGEIHDVYEFLDGGIGSIMKKRSSNWWNSGWTHLRNIPNTVEEEAELWKKLTPEQAFLRWMGQSFQGYKEVMTLIEDSGYSLDEEEFTVLSDKLKKTILAAGARTALVLTHLLQESSNLRMSGGGLKDSDILVQESRKSGPSKKVDGFMALFTNLGIGAFILLMMAAILHRLKGVEPLNPTVELKQMVNETAKNQKMRE